MHSVVLVKLWVVANFAHEDDDGRCAGEDHIACTLVRLPGIDKVGDTLLKELAVNLDVRHDGGTAACATIEGLDISRAKGGEGKAEKLCENCS